MGTPLEQRLDQISAASSAFAITPHASNALTQTVNAIYVGGDGNIACRLKDDSADVTFVGLVAGSILPVQATHVRATGTTATNLVGLV